MTPPPEPGSPPGVGARPKQPSQPEIQAAKVDRTVGVAAMGQRRQDDPRRQKTNPSILATKLPPAPAVPIEGATTVPAPRQDVPTLPAGQSAASTPTESIAAALRARAEAAEAKIAAAEAKAAELERRERVRAEAASPATFPPPVMQAESPLSSVVATRGERGERGKPSSFISQLPAVLIATTGLVTALAAIWKPAPDTKADEAYAAIREELVKQNRALQANGDSDEARFNVVIGLFKATGVKVTEAPGTPKIEPLQLQPAPLTNKVSPSSAPAIQVRDPLPPPVPSVAPVRLPVTLESLKSDKAPP
jgi:hypothetical protein